MDGGGATVLPPRAAALAVTDVRGLLEQAIALEQRGDRGGARALCVRALAAAPGHPGALLKLALLDQAEGDLPAARAGLARALAAAQAAGMPTAPIALAEGHVAEAQGDAQAAADAYERALADPRTRPPACDGLARAAVRVGGRDRALACCRAGLAVAPAHPGLLSALAHVLRAAGALDAAADAFAAAAQAAPDAAAAWLAAGNACMELEMAGISARHRAAADAAAPEAAADPLARAIAAFARAAALAPDADAPRAHLAMAARYACAWPQADAAIGALAEHHAARPAQFACSPMIAAALLADPLAQRDGIRGWVAGALPAPAPRAAPAAIARRGDRLRVGYLSSDFHDHATAHLAAGLFEHHDAARVETFAYAADADDGSAMRQRLVRAFAHWRDVRTLGDADAARRIAADALDVLVELKGHTHGTRIEILARRPAPVQIHYLGFPGTLAYDAVDALVADDVVAPAGSEPEFAEALLRLPVCYQANDRRRPVPVAPARADVGLPERALVLACFNQAYKITEPFLAAWLAALSAHADAVLWLAVPHALARRNLRGQAARAGVAPERIVFAPVVPQAAHVARLACADLALDVLPYGSHTSGSDALWAGVPLLTCRGTTFAGRVGASLLHAVGLPDLVAETPAGYARMLVELCGDRARLAHHRRHLAAGGTTLPLFYPGAFTGASAGRL